ncbi:formyltetrahydrofolate deformylase [Paraburkholderia sp. ZP32-5]|uniref:formyltetrahydrofolate deformylase n=1 Tax=Paraburkholderia sp. ZP32-5 TaxID=2883245 RepID=UPI001F2198DE|nr:formyltetrahydrofolate deformylase [Paraburkholderia sp. ZP32-5]
MNEVRYALTLHCPNRPGIVAAVACALFDNGGDIRNAHQHDDGETRMFFARLEFTLPDADGENELRERLAAVAGEFSMQWALRRLDVRQRVLIMVSRFDHCLADLLYRWRIGELPMDIVGIVANYPRDEYRHHDFGEIPFDYLPVTSANKLEQEAALMRIVDARRVDLVVLARYMQILSDDLSRGLSGRCINIHHSFLPGFKGAKPYHQAYARGVKLIGATAHYVTSDLDEGPIIEQDVERVSHIDSADVLVRKGRDIERRVLSRAVAWHLAARVMVNAGKTVVFPD